MAVPIAAALGKGLMVGGAKMLGTAGAKSTAGSMLASKSGSGKGLGDAFKQLQLALKGFEKKVLKSMKEIMSNLKAASPALKQQLIVFQKSIMIFLRPIGDVMAKFIRPMAIWAIKVARKWYQLFGEGSGEAGAKSTLEDELGQKMSEREGASALGDHDRVAELDKDIADLYARMSGGAQEASDSVGDAFAEALHRFNLPLQALEKTNEELWGIAIPALFSELWDSIKSAFSELWELLKALWDVLEPILKPVWELIKFLVGAVLTVTLFALIGAFKLLEFIFLGIKTVVELFMVGMVWLGDILEDIGNWIKDTFVTYWTNVWDLLKLIGSFLIGTFITNWNSFKEALQSLVDKVVGWASTIRNAVGTARDWLSDRANDVAEVFGKAVGGNIRETGLYQLHAGERVLTAGETSRTENNQTQNVYVTNHINVGATINHDIDIRTLARQLASYNQTELRRRVSYR